jgi:SAM-dependent methyltransferase
MLNREIERRVAAYYAGKLREFGPTAQGVDWNSDASQALRFDQFLGLIPPGERVAVLDWGCGYGAFANHLSARGGDFDYVGYDVAPEMVEAARSRLGERPGLRFTADPRALERADVTVASGVFNVLADTERDRWQDYTLQTIQELAALSRSGFGFNMLTSYSDSDRMVDRLFYADPCFYFDWCKRHLSRQVALLHDYGLYEFTILVRFDGS